MKTVTSLGSAAMALLLATGFVSACGPDTSAPVDSDATGGTTTDGSGGDASGGETSSGGNGGAPSDCDVVPGNIAITDFSEYTDGDSWTYGDPQREWGASDSLTGGDFFYANDNNSSLVASISEGVLTLTKAIPAGEYAGYGLYFGPACNDASRLSGISFELGGEIGNAEVVLQLQQKSNYPVEATKGGCMYESEDTKWSECTNNFFTLEGTGVFEVTWDQLTGGTPEATLNPGELMGLQFQFNCGDEGECPVAVTVDNITFIE